MKTINKKDINPACGVIDTNTATWLNDEIYNAIDLSFETYLEYRPDDINEDEWADMYETNGEENYLIGFKRNNGKYDVDEEAEYSAIISYPYTQIVHSKYMSYAHKSTPCFPFQNDLNTTGDYETYQLPPDMFDDDDEHLEIIEIVEDD